jgi:hypothetical protein
VASTINIKAVIDGGEAAQHRLAAYDGFMSLAGIGLTLSLTANYAETARIRRRGEYAGRHAVRAAPIEPGSILTDFIVSLPKVTIATGKVLSEAAGAAFYSDLLKRVIDRNLGIDSKPLTDELGELSEGRSGDIEALAAAVEPSIKQGHSVIGEGAQVVDIFGGSHRISNFNVQTKQYVHGTIVDRDIYVKDVSVSSFNVNSGYGGVFDFDLGRVVPIRVTRETLPRAKAALGWGLNEYAADRGRRISLRYYRWMAFDGTPKKYIVVDAEIPKG